MKENKCDFQHASSLHTKQFDLRADVILREFAAKTLNESLQGVSIAHAEERVSAASGS